MLTAVPTNESAVLDHPSDVGTLSVLTIDEAASVLRLSRNTMYELARRGEVPTLRLGRKILVPRAALEEMLRRAGGAA